MSDSKAGTSSSKTKISSDEAAEFAINGMKEIRALDATNGVKAQKERRLGKSCLVKLSGRSSRSDENKPSLSYHNREVTRLRTFIRHNGFLRHDYNDQLNKIVEEYPIASKEIDQLRDIHYEDAKDRIDDTIRKLENRHGRTQHKERKGELRKAIASLRKVKFEPVIFETLVRTATQKEELAQAAEKRVEGYHSEQRPIDYQATYELMARLLTAEHDWLSLTFGLVLACGRRSAEIICDLDGQFKSVRGRMEAEFTSHVKTKEPKTYRIPLLVDYKTFSSALERLRKHHRIASLMERTRNIDNYDQRHKEINASIQSQLNEFVKDTMKGGHWRLKDGRAMYARIAYAEYCATAKKAGRTPMADDLFFKKKLGHTDIATQQNYKQFTLQNAESLDYTEVKQIKQEASKAKATDRLSALKELFESEQIQGRRAFAKYAEWVLVQVKQDSSVKISSTWIKNNLGGNKGIIAEFVRAVRDAGLQDAF